LKPASACEAAGTTPCRELAAEILHRVETRRAYADLLLDRALKDSPLSARDRALLTELVYGTLRWRGKIDWHLGRCLHRSLAKTNARLKNLLRLAIFQILCLDRVIFAIGFVAEARAVDIIPELLALLNDEHTGIRTNASGALRALGPEAIAAAPGLAAAMDSPAAAALVAGALVEMGSEAAPVLMRLIREGEPESQIHCIEALGSLGPIAAAAVDLLGELMKSYKDNTDRSGHVSSYAAAALGKIGDSRALPYLRSVTDARNPDVRKASLEEIQAIENGPKLY
jgi:hypothetical protein